MPASAGPAPGAASSQFWVYRSNVDPTLNTQAGLAGPLVIARPGDLGADDKPKDVDREIFLMLQVRASCTGQRQASMSAAVGGCGVCCCEYMQQVAAVSLTDC